MNAAAILVVFGGLGTLFVHFNEGFSWVDSFYWSFVTLSSVGYGDLTTTHESTRIFCIFYVFFGVGATASSLGRFAKVRGAAAALLRHPLGSIALRFSQ